MILLDDAILDEEEDKLSKEEISGFELTDGTGLSPINKDLLVLLFGCCCFESFDRPNIFENSEFEPFFSLVAKKKFK